jgi:pimeloyl-ACP methyl ester carboxylesterase
VKEIFAALFLTIISLVVQAQTGNLTIAPGSNYAHRPGTKLKQPGQALKIDTIGKGAIPIIMLTEHSQGRSFYETLAKRNAAFYTFYIVTPPGFAGTPAYYWPDDAEDFITRPWLSKLENELIELIQNNFHNKMPYLFATWLTGFSVALNIADKRPDLLKGLLLVGNSINQSPYYRQYNPMLADTSKVVDITAQRATVSKYIEFWRTVDEFTWQSNTLRASFYSKNDSIAKIVKLNEAKTSFPISLRYFVECMMNDFSGQLANCKIPVLALAQFPSFSSAQKNMRGITEGIYNNFLLSCKKDWFYGINKNIQLHLFEDSGLMIWEDKPIAFDKLFINFIK